MVTIEFTALDGDLFFLSENHILFIKIFDRKKNNLWQLYILQPNRITTTLTINMQMITHETCVWNEWARRATPREGSRRVQNALDYFSSSQTIMISTYLLIIDNIIGLQVNFEWKITLFSSTKMLPIHIDYVLHVTKTSRRRKWGFIEF